MEFNEEDKKIKEEEFSNCIHKDEEECNCNESKCNCNENECNCNSTEEIKNISKIESLEKENALLKKHITDLFYEFSNFKSKAKNLIGESKLDGIICMAKESLQIIDILDLALNNKKDEVWIRSAKELFDSILLKFGIEKIPFTSGEILNIEFQEVVLNNSANVNNNIVKEELKPGYIHTQSKRIVRYTAVSISD